MMKKRGLGRGLDALLGGMQPEKKILADQILQQEEIKHQPQDGLRYLPVEHLQRGQYQPRQDMDSEALEELSESIKAQGILQPIVVRPITDQLYEIVAGERRWRAAQLAGLHEVPALIKDIPDESAIAIALIENIQRENLNPLDEAAALKRLMDEFSMTQEAVADAVGKSRTTVTNFLRLLSLNPEVKVMVERGDLDMGHARTLLTLGGDIQSEAARQVVSKDLSVRETEKLVKRLQSPHRQTKAAPEIDPNIRMLQNDLAERLGAKVAIAHNAKEKGKLIIHYHSLDELEGILGHIR